MVDVLTIDPDEGLKQIQARLTRVRSRQVYLHVPQANPVLRQRLSLARLHRTAQDRGLDLTLVTWDSATRVMAGNVGLPVRWRLPGAARVENRTEEIASSVWVSRIPLASTLLAVVLLLLGVGLAVLILPRATVTIAPQASPFESSVEIVADPEQATVDVAARRMPARRIELTLERQLQEPTTSRVEVPEAPARGTVTFVNQSESEVSIPAGSTVSTSGDAKVAFRTQRPIRLPGPAGTTGRVAVEAAELGPQGNVPAYAIDQLDPLLGLAVAVVNERSTSGGTARSVGTVTEEEQNRARARLLEQMRREALQALRQQLHETETLIEDSVEFQVVNETFGSPVGAVSDEVALNLTLKATATAVDLERARELATDVLRQRVPAEQVVVENSLTSEVERIAAGAGGAARVDIQVAATTQTKIAEGDIKNVVQGRPVEEASALLRERFPLAAAPLIEVSRDWLGRMPWLPMRIDVIIVNDGTVMGARRSNG